MSCNFETIISSTYFDCCLNFCDYYLIFIIITLIKYIKYYQIFIFYKCLQQLTYLILLWFLLYYYLILLFLFSLQHNDLSDIVILITLYQLVSWKIHCFIIPPISWFLTLSRNHFNVL